MIGERAMNIKENDLIEVEYPIGEVKQKEVLQVIKNFYISIIEIF